MKKSELWFGVIVVIVCAIIGSAVSLIFSGFIDFSSSKTTETSAPKTKLIGAVSVGNRLDCDNCHFKGGITGGGKNGGLSLVGVAATYPKYRKGLMNVEDLVTRTNDCFERSMNGKPLPPDSKEMTAIVTYYQWISKSLPIYEDIP